MLISCIGNIIGIVALIVIQYSGIIASGTFAFNSMRIVNLFPLVFLIPVGTLVSRRFFKETGNIYSGSFTIAMLYTMMTVANTMASCKRTRLSSRIYSKDCPENRGSFLV